MKTPIFGGFYVSRSLNLADQQCINLYPSTVDTKSGKEVGALYNTAGLVLKVTCGAGPIRGMEVFKGLLYVVSGNEVYSVTTGFVATLIGMIGTSTGPVSIIKNTTQLEIFDGVFAYLIPGGYPLTGGAILAGSDGYAVGDTIDLQNADGQQNATAQVQVTGISGSGVITSFSVVLTGAFVAPLPTGFTQQSTTGSGSGFAINVPTYGAVYGPIYSVFLPFSGPVSASYQDGFGVVNESGTDKWWQSNLFDLSIWKPLNFSSADAAPDNIQAIAELHEQQYLFKQTNTEVWINAGNSGFAFQRLAGVHIELGCAAPFSPTLAGEALCWLAMNEQGEGTVHMVSNYEPRKISTKAVDAQIQSYAKIADAIGYSYQQDGHLYYVLQFPSANVTWVCDLAENFTWHQRASFSNGSFSRHRSNCYAFFASKCLVGDFETGAVYVYDPAVLTDNGVAKKWVRSWRALQSPQFQPVTFSSLQIDMQTGVDVPADTNPQLVLRWSDDGGHTWSNECIRPAGKTGETALRVIFKRLGSTRLNSGLDRIFEISSTDVFPVAIIGANLEAG